jgi:hypothetical protein
LKRLLNIRGQYESKRVQAPRLLNDDDEEEEEEEVAVAVVKGNDF